MRFVFNFIFFGMLFFVIYHYFPEAFDTLVSWARAIYLFVIDVGTSIVERVREGTEGRNGKEAASLLMLLPFRR